MCQHMSVAFHIRVTEGCSLNVIICISVEALLFYALVGRDLSKNEGGQGTKTVGAPSVVSETDKCLSSCSE